MDPSLGVGIKHLRVPSLALEIPEFQLRCQQAINKQVVPFFFFLTELPGIITSGESCQFMTTHEAHCPLSSVYSAPWATA